MKRLTSGFIFFALLAATTAHAVTWQKTLDGVEGYCVQEIDDGYIVTGYIVPPVALWLLKTDTLGVTVWTKTYEGTNSVTAGGYSVYETQDKGFIITGVRWKGFSEIWLLKTDENGDTVWTRNFGESVGHCVQQTQDGGYIITGRRNWIPSELFLLKTDSLGDSLWMRTYLPVGWEFSKGLFVEETNDNGFIVAGFIGYDEEDHYNHALWVLRTDSLGDTLWTYQGEGAWDKYRQGRCVHETSDGQYIVLANFGLFKFDQDGSNLWMQEYRDGSCVQETHDGGYALAGDGRALFSLSSFGANPDGSWLLKTNGQGDSLWERTYDGLSYSFFIEQTRDRGFILTGGGFLLKTDSLGLLGVNEKPVIEADAGWKIGSPIGRRIAVFYEDLPQGLHAKVYNVTGRQVDEIHTSGNSGFITWGIGHPPGVYFIQAMDNRNQLKTAKVVLVR